MNVCERRLQLAFGTLERISGFIELRRLDRLEKSIGGVLGGVMPRKYLLRKHDRSMGFFQFLPGRACIEKPLKRLRAGSVGERDPRERVEPLGAADRYLRLIVWP